MILIDTNIISEVMRPRPSPNVIAWLNGQESRSLHVSSITLAEIRFGLHILPQGRRRTLLEERFETYINQVFADRVLDFTRHDTGFFAEIMARSRRKGHGMSFPDGQIAAIARARRAVLATRNTKDFIHSGVEIINPFNC